MHDRPKEIFNGIDESSRFVEPGRIVLDEKAIPEIGPLDALIRIAATTICGTDVHIFRGEYPMEKGLTIGHEPVGVIEKLGSAVSGFHEGQRVIAGAITLSGHSNACLCCYHSQDGAGTRHGWKPAGGWKFGNTIDGCQAEFVCVPDAMVNLSPVPDGLTDEQVLMCRTSCRQASSVQRMETSASAIASWFSLKGRSGFVPPPAPN